MVEEGRWLARGFKPSRRPKQHGRWVFLRSKPSQQPSRRVPACRVPCDPAARCCCDWPPRHSRGPLATTLFDFSRDQSGCLWIGLERGGWGEWVVLCGRGGVGGGGGGGGRGGFGGGGGRGGGCGGGGGGGKGGGGAR